MKGTMRFPFYHMMETTPFTASYRFRPQNKSTRLKRKALGREIPPATLATANAMLSVCGILGDPAGEGDQNRPRLRAVYFRSPSSGIEGKKCLRENWGLAWPPMRAGIFSSHARRTTKINSHCLHGACM